MESGVDSRISLHKLEIFCLVVELGGVGRAADQLFLTQPAVTAHLRSLQKHLGTKLFDRDGRHLRLTERGERVYAWAVETLARTREMARDLDDLADGTGGSVVVAASMSVGSYVLPKILTAFQRQRPRSEIVLTIADPKAATEAAENGACDFGIVVSKHHPEAPQLRGEELGREPLVLVAGPELLPGVDAIGVEDLETLPFVGSPQQQVRRAVDDPRLRELGLRARNITIELGHPEAMKRAVESGAGAALLFRSAVARDLEAGTLREIRIEGWDHAVPVFLLVRRDKRLTPFQAELLDELRARLSHVLAPVAAAA